MTDLGGGDAESADALRFDEIARDQRTRRNFRLTALVAALIVLAAFVFALGRVVWTFDAEMRWLASGAHAQLVPLAAVPQATTASAPTTGAAAASAAEAIVVPLASFTTALVGMVTALVLASTVLAIALVRASFTLTARGDDPRPAADADKPADGSVAVPGIEFGKAVGEAVQTALKGLVPTSTPRA